MCTTSNVWLFHLHAVHPIMKVEDVYLMIVEREGNRSEACSTKPHLRVQLL